jgi:hypothetical protein
VVLSPRQNLGPALRSRKPSPVGSTGLRADEAEVHYPSSAKALQPPEERRELLRCKGEVTAVGVLAVPHPDDVR